MAHIKDVNTEEEEFGKIVNLNYLTYMNLVKRNSLLFINVYKL